MRSYQIVFTQVNQTVLITGVNIALLLNTEFDTIHRTQYARLSAEHAHFRSKLQPADEK